MAQKTVEVQIPEPHSDLQRIIMNAPFIPDLREMWVTCGTKFGKTTSGVAGYSSFFPLIEDGVIRHIAPIYKQARIGMRYAQKFLPPHPYSKVNRSDNTIKLEGRRATIEYWHGKDAESLEGEGVLMNLYDEASKLKRSVYDSGKTTVTMTRGINVGLSTPRGKNWFHQKCMEAKAQMEWCLKKGRNPTHIFISAPTAANPFVPRESIEEAKRELPARLFAQYYLCEFIDSGDTFPFFRDSIQGDVLNFQTESQLWSDDCAGESEVVIGADWGKHNDFTVFTAFEPRKRKLIGFMRFRGVDYIQAIRNLIWFCEQFEAVELIRHDKTGLGEVMDDALATTDLSFEGITFTNKSKSSMVNSLMLAFQRKDIILPHWLEMIEELEAYEVTVSDIGNFKYAAADGFHDDIVSSMILGWSIVDEMVPSRMEVVTLDQLVDLDFDNNKISVASDDFNKWLPK